MEYQMQEGFGKGFLSGAALGLPALAMHGGTVRSATIPSTAPSAVHATNEPTTQIETPVSKLDTIKRSSSDVPEIAEYIGKHEGFKSKVYDDGKGYRTIGIGHKLLPTDFSLFSKLFGNKYDFGYILDGTEALDKNDIIKLFEVDYETHLGRAKRLLPKFDNYPAYLKAAIIDSVYRGDLSGSPKTIKLMNANKWHEAAQEYLDNREYRNSIANHMAGVAKRMKENADRFERYDRQQGQIAGDTAFV